MWKNKRILFKLLSTSRNERYSHFKIKILIDEFRKLKNRLQA